MPNTNAAKKALRGSIRKKTYNLSRKSKIVESRRHLNRLFTSETKDNSKLAEALSKYCSALDKAAKVNFINKGKADRLKSRMSVKINKFLGI